MAETNRIKAGGNSFYVVDTTARNKLSELELSKQARLTIDSPLYFVDSSEGTGGSRIAINLSNYFTKEEIMNFIEAKFDSVSKGVLDTSDKINRDHAILKKLLSSLVVDNTAEPGSGDIPLDVIPDVSYIETILDSYDAAIETIESQVKENKTTAANEVSAAKTQATTNLNNYKKEVDTKFAEQSTRSDAIERELFGDLYEAGRNGNLYDSNSRIDDIEAKVNTIYDTLVKIGVIDK